LQFRVHTPLWEMGAFCCKEGEQTGEANNLHKRRLHEKKNGVK
jgi:hypothetical protein